MALITSEFPKPPRSYKDLEELGRVRLSKNFYMREFLYSEIANFYGRPNIPDNRKLTIEVGKKLCDELLEPLNATFGRIAVRSAYRSPDVNNFGNEKGHSCASNESNYAGHIWDVPDKVGVGATACVVIPWFADRYKDGDGADWRALAYWIHNHLPYSDLYFFKNLCAFNITWHKEPSRCIRSTIGPKKEIPDGAPPDPALAEFYADFPPYQRGGWEC